MATNGRVQGIYISVPTRTAAPLIKKISDDDVPPAHLLYSEEIADEAGDQARLLFVAAGYEDDETVWATLYKIAPNGGLEWSQAYPIDGPAAS
jgi:hypothetical protein